MTATGKTAREPSDDAQIARTFFRLRAVMACIVAGLVVRNTVEAYRVHQDVQVTARTERVAREVSNLLLLNARERGLAALGADRAASEADASALAELRADLDAKESIALGALHELAVDMDDAIVAALTETLKERRRVALAQREALAHAASGADLAAETDRWITTMTRVDEALISLHTELLQHASQYSPRLVELAHLRQLSLAAAEYAGQERAILSAAMAHGAILDDEQLEELQKRRGVVEHSVEGLRAFLAPRSSVAGLQLALQRLHRELIDQVGVSRAEAYRCVSVAARCSLEPREWFARISVGVDAAFDVADTSAQLAAAELEQLRSATLRTLVGTASAGTLAFALILFAGGFVRRRIGQRLLDLRAGALEVASGRLDHAVTVPGSDEISSVARAVEQMRDTLNRRNDELHQLIDRLKEAQAQLIQQERMAFVGRVAGGVAHELNNPLSVVLSNVEYLLGQVDQVDEADKPESPRTPAPLDRAELREVLLEVRSATERSSAIVRDLRDFASGSPGNNGRTPSFDDAVAGVVAAKRGSFPRNVRIDTSLGAPLAVVGSHAALAQVLERLIDNAREACGTDGDVMVRTRRQGSCAVLSVEDTGVGIPPEHLERVLEPFFTTKRIGSATGLGLSVCAGILRQLGGELRIDSTRGRGTCVTVALPLVESQPVSAP